MCKASKKATTKIVAKEHRFQCVWLLAVTCLIRSKSGNGKKTNAPLQNLNRNAFDLKIAQTNHFSFIQPSIFVTALAATIERGVTMISRHHIQRWNHFIIYIFMQIWNGFARQRHTAHRKQIETVFRVVTGADFTFMLMPDWRSHNLPFVTLAQLIISFVCNQK